jgi:hypothetical protein
MELETRMGGSQLLLGSAWVFEQIYVENRDIVDDCGEGANRGVTF